MCVQRLTWRADFERVRAQGQSLGAKCFVVIVARSAESKARIGVAAGKRIGGAIQRNRAKRLLREGICSLYPSIALEWDILLMARGPILDVKSPQVTGVLNTALRKMKVMAAQSESAE